MERYKFFLTSKTLWGLIIAVVAELLRTQGWKVSPELEGETFDSIMRTIEAAGAVLVIVGRWKADRPLSATPEKTV